MLDPVIVYDVDTKTSAVGVPPITPLLAPKDTPAGRAGSTENESEAEAGVTVGVTLAMTTPSVSASEGDGYAKDPCCTPILTVTAVLPPELDAAIVTELAAVRAVGVPLMAPVTVLKLRPAGSVPDETPYDVMDPPELLGNLGAMTKLR